MKIGDKVICIRSRSGNEGRLGVVHSFFEEGEVAWGCTTRAPRAGMMVTSLGGPLRADRFLRQTTPVPVSSWRKLPELPEEEKYLEVIS